jgi:hypothetical protein
MSTKADKLKKKLAPQAETPKPSAADVEKFAGGGKSNGGGGGGNVKVTLHLTPELDRRLRLYHAGLSFEAAKSGSTAPTLSALVVEMVGEGLEKRGG